MNMLILLPIILPVVAGIILISLPVSLIKNRKNLNIITIFFLAIALLSCSLIISGFFGDKIELFNLVGNIPVFFAIDELGRIFASLTSCALFLIGIFSIGYLELDHGKKTAETADNIKREKTYQGFYLIVYGVLIGLDFSGNLITMYLFYELMTLTSAPLVLFTRSKDAIMATLKYMFYSFAGAYMALFGIYLLTKYSQTLSFVPGGSMNAKLISMASKKEELLILVFIMILGFTIKAGMFPFHGWLPTAHPVAPAPASAALSGIIVKSGIFSVIRVVYYVVGPSVIRGTWVQYTWIILSMFTVLMGSALAYKEKMLKKRFAYSTVSNLSYILLGLSFLNPTAFTGSILHVVFHAIIKGCMFLSAGYIIALTGKTYVSELNGLGKKMPVLFVCMVVATLGLVGMPPTNGLVSKWYLAVGALDSNIKVLSWIAPIVLLVSALLTAGYLFPIVVNGLVEKNKEKDMQQKLMDMIQNEDPLPKKIPNNYWMLIPIIIFATAIIVFGIVPGFLINIISGIASGLM